MPEEIPILAPMADRLDDVARARIKNWIASMNVTQTVVSERIGKNQAWMSRYLSGEFDADLETLQKLAHLFGHSLNALLETPADPEDAVVMDAYHALSKPRRALVLEVMRGLAPKPRPRKRTRR